MIHPWLFTGAVYEYHGSTVEMRHQIRRRVSEDEPVEELHIGRHHHGGIPVDSHYGPCARGAA